MSKAQKQALSALLIAIFAALMAVGAVRYLAPLTNLENKVADIRVAAMQRPMPASEDVVVVAVNEETLSAFPYRSPVDRGFLADLITQLSGKGAKVIGVDIIVDQPTEAEKDARLKQVLDTVQTPLFMSYTSAPNVVNEDQLAFLNAFVRPEQRAEANLLSDPFDGLVRRINPGGEMKNGRRVDTDRHPAGFVRKAVTLFGGAAPLSATEIAWRPRPDAESLPFPSFPAHFVSVLPDEFFRGKIVLIGATLSITDRHRTPLSIIDDGDQGNMPGVFIQAHGISQILEKRAPPRMPFNGIIALIRQIAGTYEQIWSRRHCRQLSNNPVKALAIKLRRIIYLKSQMDVRNLRNQHGLAFVRAQTETAVTPFVPGSIGSTIAQFFCKISPSVEKKAFPNS